MAPITRKVYAEHNTPEALELERFYSDFAQACAPGSGHRLVLVEGLFALHLEAVRERADLKVFVDLESDERLARRIVKFMAWGDTYEQVTSRYLDTVRFRHNELVEPTRWHADLVLNGTLDSHRGVARAGGVPPAAAGLPGLTVFFFDNPRPRAYNKGKAPRKGGTP